MASKSIAHVLGAIIGKVISWPVSTAFILWGWNTLAPHLNAPCSLFGRYSQFVWLSLSSLVFFGKRATRNLLNNKEGSRASKAPFMFRRITSKTK